eukprot:m51a1_g11938 putative centrosomal protein poc5 isoform 1 (248) ;mRNA; r:719856-720738
MSGKAEVPGAAALLERISAQLEQHTAAFKRSVLEDAADLFCRREEEMGALEHAARLEASLRRQGAHVGALSQALGVRGNVARESKTARAALRAWRGVARERARSERARGFHAARVARAALRAWRSASRQRAADTKDAFWQRKMEEVTSEMVRRYEAEIGRLAAELRASQEALQDAQAEQTRVQDELKKALMRGVCALNMETMAALRPAQGPAAPQTPSTSHAAAYGSTQGSAQSYQRGGSASSRFRL